MKLFPAFPVRSTDHGVAPPFLIYSMQRRGALHLLDGVVSRGLMLEPRDTLLSTRLLLVGALGHEELYARHLSSVSF